MGTSEVTIVLTTCGKQAHRSPIMARWCSWRLGFVEVVQICGRLVTVIGWRVTVHGGMRGAFNSHPHSRAATVSMRQFARNETAELVSKPLILRQTVWQV